MLENGKGVKKNLTEAADWYRKSAEQGDSDAQYNLARLYADGQGVQQDRSSVRCAHFIRTH